MGKGILIVFSIFFVRLIATGKNIGGDQETPRNTRRVPRKRQETPSDDKKSRGTTKKRREPLEPDYKSFYKCLSMRC